MSNLNELKRMLAPSVAWHKRVLFSLAAMIRLSPGQLGYVQVVLGGAGLGLMLGGVLPTWALVACSVLFFLTTAFNGMSYVNLYTSMSGLVDALKDKSSESELQAQMQRISDKYRDMFEAFCNEANVEPDSPAATREIHRLSGLMKQEIEALPGIASAQVEVINKPTSNKDLH